MSWSGSILRICSRALFLLLFFSQSALAFDLEGKVVLKPPFPEAPLLKIPEEHTASCGSEKRSPTLQVSPEGFIANAVVQLEGFFPSTKSLPLNGNFVLDQIGCEFSPHILLLPQGATLSILNSEEMLHNVRAFNERIEMLFNDAMPKKGQVLKKRFDEPGRIVLRCGIHHWMHAIAVVQEHPYYAVTDEKGDFKIEGIPEGSYTLSVWHESLGELQAKVGPGTGLLTLTYQSKE